MDGWQRALDLLPGEWRQAACRYTLKNPEEIRLRVGKRATVLLPEGEHPFLEDPVSEELLFRVLEKATGASLHTAAPALADGFVSYRGLRIGVCGTAVMRQQCFFGYRNVSSLAVRIPKECIGICRKELGVIAKDGFQNTLIVGRPGDGKTTVLRELIRALSEIGYRIGVSDERNELAASDGALAQFDLGAHSDVITGVPKVDGAMMLLRGMNPQILAMDEVSRQCDLDAVSQIFGCGVGLLVSAHGTGSEDLKKREGYRSLLEQGMFTWLLRVSRTGYGRSYELERIGP